MVNEDSIMKTKSSNMIYHAWIVYNVSDSTNNEER
jgi:hypothetical protein